MTEYRVYAGDSLVGYSNLEKGDPPMGVAFGWMTVTSQYAQIADAIRVSSERIFGDAPRHENMLPAESTAEIPPIKVQTPDGEYLEAVSALILDYEIELGRYKPEVQVLGIPSEMYSRLFPHHWKTYLERLRAT